jgi:predicted O-methyltransferase YrrM
MSNGNPVKSFYKFLSPRWQKVYLDYRVKTIPRYGHGKPPHKLLNEIINKNREGYKDLIARFLSYREVFFALKTQDKEQDDTQPAYNNKFLPGLDIVVLYGLICQLKPKRYVEIGSGNSTKVVRKAIKDEKLATIITSIDPFPRVYIDNLADKVIRSNIEDLNDLSFADELEENDFLFIDGSHRSFANSDTTMCFLDLLPRLKKGVIVHIHDIYLPYDYPPFMCERFYNEEYLLACMLLSGNRYEVLFPNFFISEDKELSAALKPLWEHPGLKGVEQHGGSFWMKVKE